MKQSSELYLLLQKSDGCVHPLASANFHLWCVYSKTLVFMLRIELQVLIVRVSLLSQALREAQHDLCPSFLSLSVIRGHNT